VGGERRGTAASRSPVIFDIRRLVPAGAAVLLLAVSGAAPVCAQDSPPPPAASADVVLTPGDGPVGARVVLRYRDPGAVPPALRRQAVEEGGDAAVAPCGEEGLELRFFRAEMLEVVSILGRAREGLEVFPVTIRIPAGLGAGDVWTFQARLSQAGIRQVRIVTDPPSVSVRPE
jgi:hypothetical protein